MRLICAAIATVVVGTAYGAQLAKFEPATGCYIGAFVQLDPVVKGDLARFEQLTQRKHASYFRYSGYGMPFPAEWVERVKAAGAVPHIAWEPLEGLDPIAEDDYLAKWAEDARDAACPIFLRFASEMNGTWMPYSGDPKKYVEKFRLVHDVLERIAPNVAMVWCVFATPIATIKQYYPGDEYVDWVGVNVYSVLRHDGDPNKPAGEDPRDMLDFVYREYADRKPIQISEYAATHYCRATDQKLVDFAIGRMSVLYASLPKQLPRVKMINWFSVNAVDEQLAANNYALTSEERVLDTYAQLVSHPHFLTEVVGLPTPTPPPPEPPVVVAVEPTVTPPEPAVLPPRPRTGVNILLLGASGDVLRGKVVVLADVGTQERPTLAAFSVDGRVRAVRSAAPFRFGWDSREVADGTHTLKVALYDEPAFAPVSQALTVAVENR
ncbi:MAG: glycosyl hydrolase [Armatimonadota bacterium]|jgi:hypothetical protein